MPELPEVEVTRRTLLKFIENKVIKNIKINHKGSQYDCLYLYKFKHISIYSLLLASFLVCKL